MCFNSMHKVGVSIEYYYRMKNEKKAWVDLGNVIEGIKYISMKAMIIEIITLDFHLLYCSEPNNLLICHQSLIISSR